MREVPTPVAHRTDVHPENCGDLLGLPPPSSVSRIARARSASPRCSDFDKPRKAARSAASAVSVDFPGMLGLHSPHPRQTIHSIAHSQAVCIAVLHRHLGLDLIDAVFFAIYGIPAV